jgi:hypothetical protein
MSGATRKSWCGRSGANSKARRSFFSSGRRKAIASCSSSSAFGRGEQLADAFRAGYFDDPGTGRDQNAAFGEMHTFPELRPE